MDRVGLGESQDPWRGFSRHPVAAEVQPPQSAAAASASFKSFGTKVLQLDEARNFKYQL